LHKIRIQVASVYLFLFFTFSYISLSKDNELWTGYEWQFPITNELSLKFGEQVRMYRDVTTVKQLLNDFGFKSEVFDFLDATAYYRLRMKQDNPTTQTFLPYHELNLALTAGYEYKPVDFSFRMRYQKEFRDDKKSDDEYLRSRILAETKITKELRPFVYYELFYRMNYHKGDRFDNYRLGLGMEWRAFKNVKFEAMYSIEEEFNMEDPQSKNIFGLNVSFSLDKSESEKAGAGID
ncbi:MAG: DUF2490 domain-containing protein, partial [Bacteroidales bacterium]|nr:DUF2490 domain-containing protein [Bacteroidales bacterium]